MGEVEMAEAQHDMQDALHALRLWRAQIEAHTAQAQEAIEGIGAQARANAYGIAEQGQTIGPPGQRLATGGASDWVAPNIHPVWAPEVAYEARTVERMGAATFEYEPQQRKLEAWQAAGKPAIAAADDYAQSAPLAWPTQAEQQAYEDRPYDLMEARAHGADERDEIREQIAAIQERLDDNGPFEDWAHPGRYYGHNDDELDTRLYGQLHHLQDRLDVLTHEAQTKDHDREQGMSY